MTQTQAQLKLKIKKIVSQMIKNSWFDTHEIAERMRDEEDVYRISSKIINSWKAKHRVMRMEYFRKFMKALSIPPNKTQVLLYSLQRYTTYLRQDFDSVYKDIDKLVHTYSLRLSYPYFTYSREDFVQECMLMIWRRYDDRPKDYALSTYVFKMCSTIATILFLRGMSDKRKIHSVVHLCRKNGSECDDIRKPCKYKEQILPYSLDYIVNEDEHGDIVSLGDMLADDSNFENDFYTNEIIKFYLEQTMQSLNARQKDIIQGRFFEGLTLEKVGKKHKVCRERIRQIEEKTLNQMQRAVKRLGLHGSSEHEWNNEIKSSRRKIRA